MTKTVRLANLRRRGSEDVLDHSDGSASRTTLPTARSRWTAPANVTVMPGQGRTTTGFEVTMTIDGSKLRGNSHKLQQRRGATPGEPHDQRVQRVPGGSKTGPTRSTIPGGHRASAQGCEGRVEHADDRPAGTCRLADRRAQRRWCRHGAGRRVRACRHQPEHPGRPAWRSVGDTGHPCGARGERVPRARAASARRARRSSGSSRSTPGSGGAPAPGAPGSVFLDVNQDGRGTTSACSTATSR